MQYPILANRLTAIAMTCLLAACANPRDVGRSNDAFRIEPGRPNVLGNPTEEGVFNTPDGKIAVKYQGRSLLSVIDELAYKLGFNYTVLSDLTSFKLTVEDTNASLLAADDLEIKQLFGEDDAQAVRSKQKIYANELELLDDIKQMVNAKLQSRGLSSYTFDYTWVSDGPEFSLVKANGGVGTFCFGDGECESASFKKLFLKNVTSEEGARTLSDLFASEVELKRVSEVAVKPSEATGGYGGMGSQSFQQQPFFGGNQFGGNQFGGQGGAVGSEKAALLQYKPQNALVIRSKNPNVYRRIAAILPSLDANFNQVLVETQVFEYDDSVAKRIGAALTYTKDASDTSNGITKIATQFGEGITNFLPNFLYQLSLPEQKASLLTALALYDRDGLVRILAEPRLVLKSGEQAEVKLESRRYYLTSGVNVAGDLKELNTGIDFKVIPTVLGDDKILLNLFIRQSEFIPSNDANVTATTNNNEIHTSLIAKDGELVSIGGIHVKKDSKFSSGIRGLRHIPWIGPLFGSDAADGSVVRVDFMIRPTVSRATEVGKQKLKALQEVNCRINQQMGKEDPLCKAFVPKVEPSLNSPSTRTPTINSRGTTDSLPSKRNTQ